VSFRASGDLQAILDDDGSLTEQKTRNCIREVLKALDYLHRRNVAHLDIKPQNILLNSNNLEGKSRPERSKKIITEKLMSVKSIWP
jgi:serine/threonine protein kinase